MLLRPLRLDKWPWYARFFKTRSLAAKLCAAGAVRIGGAPVTKAHHSVRPGDVLTFAQGRHIRVIKIVALGVTARSRSRGAGAVRGPVTPGARDGDAARGGAPVRERAADQGGAAGDGKAAGRVLTKVPRGTNFRRRAIASAAPEHDR